MACRKKKNIGGVVPNPLPRMFTWQFSFFCGKLRFYFFIFCNYLNIFNKKTDIILIYNILYSKIMSAFYLVFLSCVKIVTFYLLSVNGKIVLVLLPQLDTSPDNRNILYTFFYLYISFYPCFPVLSAVQDTPLRTHCTIYTFYE